MKLLMCAALIAMLGGCAYYADHGHGHDRYGQTGYYDRDGHYHYYDHDHSRDRGAYGY